MRLLLPTKLRSFSCAFALTISFTTPCLGFIPSYLSLLSGSGHILVSSINRGYRGTTASFTRVVVSPAAQNLHAKMSSSVLSESTKSDSLFLFDFDGVVCDSCDECTVSAWRTCKILNAIAGEVDGDHPPQWLFDNMREIRPAIEVGWQIPVLLSVFLEQKANAVTTTPMSVPEIIQNYEELVEEWLLAKTLKKEDMISTFGTVRDDWIANDLNSWLDINTFYNGISHGIANCSGEAVLVTTKQQRFATKLVRHAGIEEEAMANEDIYGLGMYKSKADVIVDRMNSGYEASNTHFFEDRWPTIAKCLKDDRLDGIKLFLCSWGYCTKEELELAHNEPRVEVLKLDDFSRIVTG